MKKKIAAIHRSSLCRFALALAATLVAANGFVAGTHGAGPASQILQAVVKAGLYGEN
jgi:hypothetical protein